MRFAAIAALVLLSIPSVARAWEPSEKPIVAPTGCVEPVGTDGFPQRVARGPRLVGTYTLTDGKSLDTPRLRLRAYGEFIPERLGSKRGEVQARFEAQLLPEVKRDGENPDNSVFTSAPGVLRILDYRVSLRVRSTTKPYTYEAKVEQLGCPEEGTVPPLAAQETRTFWISTDGVMAYSFSLVPWYMNGDRMQATLLTSLAPDVQQTDKANPHGYLSLNLFEGLDGHPASTEFTNDAIAGAKATLQDYKVEVLRVVWGKDTRLVGRELITRGAEPAASILVRVTRLQVTPRGY